MLTYSPPATGGGGTGVDDAEYVVTAAHADLSAEVLFTTLMLAPDTTLNRPAAGDVKVGTYFPDTTTGFLQRSNGATWVTVATIPVSASATAQGIVELATIAETTTGTDATRAITPDGLAGSDYGMRLVQIQVTDPAGDALTLGDGKAYFSIPTQLNGYNLVDADATLTTVSSSGNPTIQIARIRGGVTVDTLSTKIVIDATELTSFTTSTPTVIDAANDDAATGDLWRVDIDTAGTGAKGLAVLLAFQAP